MRRCRPLPALRSGLIFTRAPKSCGSRAQSGRARSSSIPARALHYILGEGEAIRYGVAVGKQGFDWAGIAKIGRKVEWPKWTPPRDMIVRRPELAKYADGVPPGPDNPLGARAMYLFAGGRDTLYRIHGTNEPRSIGHAASSGCIRMLNEEVIDLYGRSPLGTKVIVL